MKDHMDEFNEITNNFSSNEVSIQSLRKLYELRFQRLEECVKQTCTKIESDSLISTMKNDPDTNVFVGLRAKEITDYCLQSEQEILIDKLTKQYSFLKGELSSVKQNNQKSLNSYNQSIIELQDKNAQLEEKVQNLEFQYQNTYMLKETQEKLVFDLSKNLNQLIQEQQQFQTDQKADNLIKNNEKQNLLKTINELTQNLNEEKKLTDELQKKLNDSQIQLMESNEQRDSNIKKNQELTYQNDNLFQDIETFRKYVKKNEDEIKLLKNQINDLTGGSSELHSTLGALKQQTDQEKQQIQNSNEQKIKQLELEIKQLVQKQHDLEKHIQEQNDELNDLQKNHEVDVENLRVLLKEQDKSKERISGEYDQQIKDITLKLRDELRQKTDKLTEMRQKLDSKEQKILEIEQQIAQNYEEYQSEMRIQVSQFEIQKSLLLKDLSFKESKLKENELIIEEINNKHHNKLLQLEQESLHKDDKNKSHVLSLKQKLQEADLLNNEFKHHQLDLEGIILKQEENILQQEKTIQELTITKQSHINELKLKDLMMVEFRQQIDNFTVENQILQQSFKSLNEKYENAHNNLINANESKEELQQQLQEVKFQQNLLKLNSENEIARIKFSSRQNLDEKNAVLIDLKQLKKQIDLQEQESKKLKSQLYELQSEATSRNQLINSVQDQNAELQQEIEIKHINNMQLQKESSYLSTQFNMLSESLKSIHEDYDKIKKNLKDEQQDKQRIIQNFEQKVLLLVNECDELHNKFNQEQQNYDKTLQECHEKLQDQRLKLKDYKKDKQILDKQLQTLQEKVEYDKQNYHEKMELQKRQSQRELQSIKNIYTDKILNMRQIIGQHLKKLRKENHQLQIFAVDQIETVALQLINGVDNISVQLQKQENNKLQMKFKLKNQESEVDQSYLSKTIIRNKENIDYDESINEYQQRIQQLQSKTRQLSRDRMH